MTMRPLMQRIAVVTMLFLSITASASESSLTNQDVVKLSQLGIGDPAVIAKIRQSPAVNFQLDIADLAALKKAGVSGTVIAAMLDRATAHANASSATDAGSLKEPDYIGNFCWRNPGTGQLTPLERQTGSSALDIKAMGFGGAESYIRVAGDRSSVRIKEGESADFVVLASSQNVDPQSLAKLFVLDVVGEERRLPVARAASMGISGRAVASESEIQFRAVPYGKSSFLFTPIEPLGPGEYAFASASADVGFCFGVDANAGSGLSRFERVIAYKQKEIIPLGISQRGMTVHSVQVIRWPGESALRKLEQNADAKGEIVVMFTQTNRAGRDYKCAYEVVLLDESDSEIGTGKRTVGIEDGEEEDTVRVGINVRLADLDRASKMRVRAVPAPDL